MVKILILLAWMLATGGSIYLLDKKCFGLIINDYQIKRTGILKALITFAVWLTLSIILIPLVV